MAQRRGFSTPRHPPHRRDDGGDGRWNLLLLRGCVRLANRGACNAYLRSHLDGVGMDFLNTTVVVTSPCMAVVSEPGPPS